jgi:predicted transcriptional regulator
VTIPPRPTEGELAILQVLWDQDAPCTVREVHDALSRHKDTAYTTVLKMMTIMADKGLVQRDETERTHRYAPAHARPEVEAVMVRDLMQRAFSGSALQLVQRALDAGPASGADLDAMEALIAAARLRRVAGSR